MTRDSAVLKVLSISAIVLAVVAAVTDPASLGIKPVVFSWIKLISTIVGTISGWASTSWLPGKDDAGTVKPPSGVITLLLVAAIGAAAGSVSACGATVNGNLRHQAVVGNTAIYETLASIQDSADGLLKSGAITLEQRRAIGVHLLPALKSGRDLVHITQAWKPGTPAPLEFMALAKNVQALIVDVTATMPDSAQTALLAKLETIKDQLLNLFVQFAGGEPSPTFDAMVASFN